jgi:hypothetical protein
MRRLTLHLLLLGCLPLSGRAQEVTGYPQGYFRNPLGIPIVLAGNFGECRPGHFHSGIDIKTQGRENLPVYAAAAGYVSRMKTEPGGFGHALYITHPNGYTTVYAHLNDFAPALQKYLREQQYKAERWNVDLVLPPDMFPVKKGEQIAWSGNTGGSTAPHLHFEIRDSRTEHPLNAQLFGFPYADQVAPQPLKLAIYRNPATEIYHQSPRLVSLRRKGNSYMPAAGDTIVIDHAEETGIGIEVNDFMDGSTNTLAFYTASVYLDGEEQCRVRLDNIGYGETRYLHAYADYKTRQEKKLWIQCLFRLPGNWLPGVYEFLNERKGLLQLTEGAVHELIIVLTDAAGNESRVQAFLRQAPPHEDQQEDTAQACTDYFHVNQINRIETVNLAFTLEPDALYTDLCFRFDRKADNSGCSDRFMLHDPTVPVHRYFELRIRPNKPVPFSLRDKIVLLYHDGNKESGKAAVRDENGWYKASVRSFGSYRLAVDTIPPVVASLNGKSNVLTGAKEIRFRATDAMTSVKQFRAELNGKWLLFEQSGHTFFYRFDDRCPKGRHNLKITAWDESGNKTVFHYPFTR